jgi:ribonuclease HI
VAAHSVHPSERALAPPSPDGDLWEKLDALADMHQISDRCIVGQVGYPDKERCEELAESQAKLNAGVPCKRSLAGKAA